MSKQVRRRGWALMVVLVVLGVIVALGGTLMSSVVRQRLEQRRSLEEQQARWLAASVARMNTLEASESWKPSLAANAPTAQLQARIVDDPTGQHRIVVESAENRLPGRELSESTPPDKERRRIIYSEVLSSLPPNSSPK